MNPQVTFVTRLRRERMRQGISLEDIARVSSVRPELFEAFENNDLTDWPKGLYARAWVRAYAEAVGLDPADTVDEFCRLYLHGDRRARSTMRELGELHAGESAYRDDIVHEDRRRSARVAALEARRPWYTPLVQFWRTLRARLAALFMMGGAKPRRAPRTSG